MPEKLLSIETTACLVNNRRSEAMDVRQGNGIVPAVILCESEANVRIDHCSVSVELRRNVVYPIEAIPLGKVVVQPQRTYIQRGGTRQESLIAPEYLSGVRVDRSAQPDLRKIGVDQCLHSRI